MASQIRAALLSLPALYAATLVYLVAELFLDLNVPALGLMIVSAALLKLHQAHMARRGSRRAWSEP